ncbi:MAG: CPBP family intramembrane glutamic endopeptidase [Pseudomonadota bacterium]
MISATLPDHRSIYASDPARGWMPWGALAPVIALAFVVATQLCGTSLIAPLGHFDRFGNPLDANSLVIFALVPFGLLLLLVLGWVHFVERRSLASVGLRHHRPVLSFLRGHAIGLVSLSAVVVGIWLAGGYSVKSGALAWQNGAVLRSILMLLFALALQSSTEELLFRGWLLSVLTRKFNVFVGVLVSSLLFALLHHGRGDHWLVTLGTFLFALYAAGWALRSRSILGVMGWHSGWNWLLATGYGLPLTGLDLGIPPLLVGLESGGPAWLTGGAQGPEASVVCLGYFAVSIVFFWRRLRSRQPAS